MDTSRRCLALAWIEGLEPSPGTRGEAFPVLPYTQSTTWAHDFPGQPLDASTLRSSLLKRPLVTLVAALAETDWA